MINDNTLPSHRVTYFNYSTAETADRLLSDVVNRVKNFAVKEFLESVLNEPEIHHALTAPVMMSISPTLVTCTYPIQALRRAGELAAYWYGCRGEERDALFVATLIQGAQKLLEPVVLGCSTAEDVMFTLARRPLHRLDDLAPRCSKLLRLSLGWGCDDEVDDFYVPRLQLAVQRAVTQVAIIAVQGTPAIRSHQCNDKRSHHSRQRLTSLREAKSCPI